MTLRKTMLAIFPDRAGQVAGFINLDDCARLARRQGDTSPFLNPRLTERFLAAVSRRAGVDYTLGGYLEGRQNLWRGSYLDPEQSTHLGIDVNVGAGTAVAVAHACRVVGIVHDADQDGGWGSVVFLELEKPAGANSHFLYAHLGADSITVKPGDRLCAGGVVGRLGQPECNGGWFAHLHVQAMTREAWNRFGADLKKFDGYGQRPQAGDHPLFPDPLPLLG